MTSLSKSLSLFLSLSLFFSLSLSLYLSPPLSLFLSPHPPPLTLCLSLSLLCLSLSPCLPFSLFVFLNQTKQYYFCFWLLRESFFNPLLLWPCIPLPASPNFRQAGCIPLSTETHAGEDVSVYARGPWAHLFHATHDQSYIYHVMEHAACVGRSKRFCWPNI